MACHFLMQFALQPGWVRKEATGTEKDLFIILFFIKFFKKNTDFFLIFFSIMKHSVCKQTLNNRNSTQIYTSLPYGLFIAEMHQACVAFLKKKKKNVKVENVNF